MTQLEINTALSMPYQCQMLEVLSWLWQIKAFRLHKKALGTLSSAAGIITAQAPLI